MRNLKSVIRKLEEKLGFKPKKMYVFRVSDNQTAAGKIAAQKLRAEYLATHEKPALTVNALYYRDLTPEEEALPVVHEI